MNEPPFKPSTDAVEQQVEALVERFVEQLQAGETPDRPAVVAAHPVLVDRRLALVEMMCRAARSVPSGEPLTPPGRGVGDEGFERALQLKCPHCGNRIQVVQPELHEVTCRNCGSSFQVDAAATAVYRPDQLPATVGKFQVLELLGRGALGAV